MGDRCVSRFGPGMPPGTDSIPQLLSSKTPTVRILNGHDNHFVISCPADVSIWRPLAEHGHRVYTQELILTSALRQQFSPSETAFQVPGSY